jgi:hypothetical protein
MELLAFLGSILMEAKKRPCSSGILPTSWAIRLSRARTRLSVEVGEADDLDFSKTELIFARKPATVPSARSNLRRQFDFELMNEHRRMDETRVF